MDVTIIIINYITSNLVSEAVKSIYEKTCGCSFEVIIADNNSPDNSLAVLNDRLRDYPDIKILPINDNIGFGRANNACVKIANGRNILFLNPDTLLRNDAPSILSDYLDKHPDVGACGGNLFDGQLKPVRSFHRWFPSILNDFSSAFFSIPEIAVFGLNRFFNFSGKVIEVAYISGADLMIPKIVLDDLGAFSPNFFMYYEETELCWRIKKKGLKIISEPSAEIIHLEGKSFSNMERKATIVGKSRNTYFELTHSKPYKVVANIFFFFNCLYRMLYGIIKNREYYKYWKTIFKSIFA